MFYVSFKNIQFDKNTNENMNQCFKKNTTVCQNTYSVETAI